MSRTHVHYFVFDGLADWEAAYAVAGINSPDYQQQPGRYRVTTVAAHAGLVTTAGGVRIQPDLMLGDLAGTAAASCAMLILPGGKAWDEGGNGQAIETARHVLTAGGSVAAICGATLGLARAGLLNTRNHTSNSREYLGETHYFGGLLYQDQRAVTDGQVITAAATAPVDFAFEIFKALDLFTPRVLEAWYGLFTTGEPQYFAALSASAKQG